MNQAQAVVLVQQKEPLHIRQLKIKSPIGHQVLVRIYASSLCGAQFNEIQGIKGPDPFLPHLMGHEGSGVVESVGEEVTKVASGDRVVLHWRKGSGGEGPFPKYETAEGDIFGGGHVTSFATMALISENRLTKIEDDIPFDIACLFGCGIPTGWGIVHNELRLRAGASVAVIGCGGVGLNVIHAATLVGASTRVAVDRVDGFKEKLAIETGATHYRRSDTQTGLSADLRDIVKQGFDAIIDTTGDTNLMAEGFRALNKNGVLMLVGHPPVNSKITLSSALDLFTKKIVASEGGGFEPDRDMPKLQDLYRKNPDAMQKLVTHTFQLEQINEAFATLQLGQCGRILLNMDRHHQTPGSGSVTVPHFVQSL